MKNNIKSHKNLYIILSFIIISYIGISIMLWYHFIPGAHDQVFYINKAAELADCIKHFTLPQFGFNYLRGSALMTMYPYINLLPLAILSFFIKSKVMLEFISYGTYILLTLLISYYSSIRLNKSRCTSYLFAIIYAMTAMGINYMFGAADPGESDALAWIPLIIFGFVTLMKSKTKWLELSVGLTLIIGTHVLSALIAITVIVFLTVINIKEIDKKIFFSLSKAAISTIMASAMIWIPALLFMHDNPTFVRPVSLPIWKSMVPLSLLIKYCFLGSVVEGPSIFAIIEIILGIMFFRHFDRYGKQMFCISMAMLFFSSGLFPWKLLPSTFIKIFMQFQYTTRFYPIPQMILDYLFASTVVTLPHNKKFKYELTAIIALMRVSNQLCKI